MRKNKKSQITVFIIIGVILLFSTALVLYIKSQISATEQDVKVSVEKVPNEVQPIQQYVTECLYTVSKQAFDMVGAHGGYISLKDYHYSRTNFVIDDSNPTEADAVAFPPGTNNHVAYWEFMQAPNKCKTCYIGSYRPPLYSSEGENAIESQVNRYVEASLRDCLRNFREFRNEGYTINEMGILKATTMVRERDVLISLEYPLEVSQAGGEKIKLSKYQTILPIAFKKIYGMATHIINNSVDSRFLGLNTLNLIAGFSRIDEDALPPFAALSFTFDTVEWSKAKVKETLKQILEIYTQVLQVEGAANYGSPGYLDDPFMRGLYGQMVLPGEGFTNLEVKFMYLGWPYYLDFVGSNSDTLKPSKLEMPILNLLPFNDYSFVYDISYPVIVRVEDPSAYNGKGYSFVFAMEANVRNNDAITDGTATLAAITEDISRVSEFCSEGQRNSGIIKVKTKDADTGEPIDNVNVVFRASQQCSMGRTRIDNNPLSENFGDAAIETRFPVGLGTLVLSKAGYQTKYLKLATSVDKEQSIEVKLDKVKFLSANVSKRKLGTSPLSLASLSGTTGEEVTDDDTIIINVEKIKEFAEEDPLVSTFIFSPDAEEAKQVDIKDNASDFNFSLNVPGINSTQKLMLVPGKYKVLVNYIYTKQFVIPEEEICEGGIFNIGGECEEVPELVFESYIYPLLEYEWDVSEEDLDGATEVKFFALYADLPQKHKDLDRISKAFKVLKNNINYPLYKPEIR